MDLGLWSCEVPSGLVERDAPWCAARGIDPCLGPDATARWLRQVHPEDQQAYSRALAALWGGERLCLTYRVRGSDGAWHRLTDTARVVARSAEGNPLRAIGASVDADVQSTPQERALQELQTAMQAARTAVWEVRASDWTSSFSDSFFTMLGVSPADGRVNETFWREHVHPEDRDRVNDAFMRHVAGETRGFEEEYRLRHADGRWLWVLSRAQATYRDTGGNPLRINGITVDIHQRRLAEDSLRESEERFRMAAASANGVVYEADLLRKRSVLHGIERVTGHAADSVLSTFAGWMQNIHPEDRARVQASIRANRVSASQYEMTYRVGHRDGRTIYVWHRGIYLRDEHGVAVKAVGIIEDVTAPIQTKQALRRSEFRLQAVVEMTPGYVFQVTLKVQPPGHEIFASESFERLMGCSHEQFIKDGAYERFCDAQSLARLLKAFDSMQAGLNVDVQIHGHNYRGQELWLRVQSRPVYDSLSGRRAGTIGAVQDITAARCSEIALSESRLVLQTLASASPTQLALFDTNRRCLFANFSLRGRPVEEILGLRVEDLLPPEAAERGRVSFDEVLRTGEGRDAIEVVHFPGGPPRTLEIRTRPVRSEERIVGIVSNITDVTENRRQQDSLNLQALIIDTMREGVLLLDRSGVILLTNPALDQMFGYARSVLVGRSAQELAALERPRFQAVLAGVLEDVDSGQGATLEVDGRRADGSRLTTTCIVTGVVIAEERRIIVVVNDTTERKQLEREVLQVATREQQRIGGDLHDGLGQQLTGIAMLLKGMSRRFGSLTGRGLRQQMETVIKLVNDAIESTRSLARGLSPVSGNRNGVIAGLEELANRTYDHYAVPVTVQFELPEILAFDENTATQLYRIAQEAVANAIKHGKARKVSILLRVSDGQAELLISDNGGGFDPRRVLSSGTGLKIMRFRAQMAGGYIAVESAPGFGTNLRCHCPVRPEFLSQ
jgi:PAS domain S-box-containing protein